MSGSRVFRSQHAATLTVIGTQHRLTLLLIPPEADPGFAQRRLLTTERRGNTGTIDPLLSGLTEDTAVLRWEVEGGRPAQAEPVDP
ncbi:hypothetical protein [Amycolatopsis jejuensis]|uniref:hypothetical protein n=1 Tax=Amycolatopsis jejuensis TaxID=330084 RepID=UPI0005273A85|nr:hypothetical protein [Amycolatopsis jejuensis]